MPTCVSTNDAGARARGDLRRAYEVVALLSHGKRIDTYDVHSHEA